MIQKKRTVWREKFLVGDYYFFNLYFILYRFVI